MIRSIFYSKFDVYEGPKVVHQVPSGSVTPSPASTSEPLINFSSISATIIPRQDFCAIPLSLLSHPYRVLSYPVCLTSPSYPRNEFIFSFSLLLHHRTSTTAYAPVVARLAGLFKHLEETTGFLSKDASSSNTGRLYAICEILLEDLNNYCEAMIPVDESNTLNIKLFPAYPPPPPLAPHHVPLATVRLSALTDSNWDLTMVRIMPYIDGVNSLRSIARLSNADYKLVRKAVAHLVYYGCAILLDVFNFNASYAPSSEMSSFVEDTEMQEEGQKYALAAPQRYPEDSRSAELRAQIDGAKLVELYCSLRQGHSVKNWCLEHAELVGVIDVRRFITFGVIKGFLYRIHKYAIATTGIAKLSATSRTPVSGRHGTDTEGSEKLELLKFLDGTHCFDEICTELMISEKELVGRLKSLSDIQIIQK